MQKRIISRIVMVLSMAIMVVGGLAIPASAAATPNQGVLFHSDRDGDNEIYLANATTGQLIKKLTNNTKDQDEFPSWHPQGNKFVYTSYNDTMNPQVFIKDINGSQPVKLSKSAQLSYQHPVFSPDGQRVAVVTSDDATGQSCIRLINVQSGAETILRCAPERASYELPAWSPDGQRLMITLFDEQGNGPNRYVLKVSTGAFELLIPGAYTGIWSPNGAKIAFSRLRGAGIDTEQVFLINSNGTGEQAITNDPNRSRRAVAWYPSGNRILTVSFSDAQEGAGLRSITTTGTGEVVFPTVGEAFDHATVNAVR